MPKTTPRSSKEDSSWQPTVQVQSLMKYFEVNYNIPPALFLAFFGISGVLVLGIIAVLVAGLLSTFAFI